MNSLSSAVDASRSATPAQCPLGVYGLRVEGLEGAAEWMQPVEPCSPLLTVEVVPAPVDEGPHQLDHEFADLALVGGARMVAHRGEAIVRFSMPLVPPAAELVHPYLAPAAALRWTWERRAAIHGGAVTTSAGAVLVLGTREAGKSTTLAALAARGFPVLADDLVIVDEAMVLAGPRGIDLRHSSARLGAWEGQSVRSSAGGRLRMALPVVPGRTPVTGVVLLAWGDAVAARACGANERLGILASQRSFPNLGGDEVALLDLAALPMVELSRPRGRVGLESAVDTLVERYS